MSFYGQAMIASPEAKEILDNVAEALNAVPPENRKAPVVLQAVALFAQQDALLQQTAAQQGMYRWGATWVNAKQLQDLKAAELKIKQTLDNIQLQNDVLQQKIGQIDSEIDANQREMDRLSASRTYTDKNGNVIQLPLPDVYYQIQLDTKKLAANKLALSAAAKRAADSGDASSAGSSSAKVHGGATDHRRGRNPSARLAGCDPHHDQFSGQLMRRHVQFVGVDLHRFQNARVIQGDACFIAMGLHHEQQ